MYKATKNRVIVNIEKEEELKSAGGILLTAQPDPAREIRFGTVTSSRIDDVEVGNRVAWNVMFGTPLDDHFISLDEADVLFVDDAK